MNDFWLVIFPAAFLLGVTSSFHCVGMCGPFVASFNLASDSKFLANLLYNFGRLLGYSGIGLILGFAGNTFNLAGENFLQIQKFAAVISSVIIVLFGISLIFHKLNITEQMFNAISRNLFLLIKPLNKRGNGIAFTFTLGLFTTLLPCGTLYPAFVLAFSTGGAVSGLLSMFAFFLGTLPLIFAFGIGFAKFRPMIKSSWISFTGVVIVVTGISSVAFRFSHDHSVHERKHSIEPKENTER